MDEVERVAVLMCEEMGLDPMELIKVSSNPTVCPPGVHEFTHRRWETLKPQAAYALAGWRAVQKYVLTET